MLSRESQPLDAVEIGRNRSLWLPVSRGLALSESRSRTVAVVHRAFGRDTASLFQPSNRFYRSNGPYLYEGLRYFLYMGAGVQALKGGGGSLGRTNKPPEAELEPLEFEDQATGEFRSLGSPTAKVPKKPPGVPDKVELALEIAGEIKDPKTPEIPDIPDLPTIPEFAIPTLPEIPVLPELPKIKHPIEFQLLDAKGKPIAGRDWEVILPDGTTRTGVSGADGFIRFPDNLKKGEAKLFLKPASSRSSALPGPEAKA